MKRFLCLTLALMMLMLCACAPKEEPTEPPTETQVVTDPPTDPPTNPPTDPPILYRNPLTGEPLDEPYTSRPFTVMISNDVPPHGISEPDILYESLTNDGETRFMGVFSDLASVKSMGTIRSARRHFVNISLSYDAIFVHYGKSDIPGHPEIGAQQYMDKIGIDHMDGTTNGYPYFFNNLKRDGKTYAAWQCHFLVGQRAIDYAKDKGFPLTRGEEVNCGLLFDDEKIIVGKPTNTININFNSKEYYSYMSTKLEYNKESNKYLAVKKNAPYPDAATGEQLAFRNVLVLRAPTETYRYNSIAYAKVNLEGSGEGYFACNGQLVPIRWTRKNASDPFTYTLEDGTPLTLGVGKTYIAIVPNGASVTYE